MPQRRRPGGGAVVGLLTPTQVLLAMVLLIADCGPSPEPNTGGEGTTTSSTDSTSTSTGQAMSADVTSVGPSSTDSTSATSTGAEQTCPVGRDHLVLPVGARTEEWPEEGGFANVECTATATSVMDDFVFLDLACLHPGTETQVGITITVPDWLAADRLDDLPGSVGLLASFYATDGLCGAFCFQLTLREPDGSLILLSQAKEISPSVENELSVDVTFPDWLRPSDPGFEGWTSPFDDLVVLGAACEEQAEPVGLVVPLAMEFTSDTGPLRVHHDTLTENVLVGGAEFDVALRAFNYVEPDRFSADAQVQFVAIRSGP